MMVTLVKETRFYNRIICCHTAKQRLLFDINSSYFGVSLETIMYNQYPHNYFNRNTIATPSQISFWKPLPPNKRPKYFLQPKLIQDTPFALGFGSCSLIYQFLDHDPL